ncbi:MAG: iron-containing alcohol dehydrogenase [Clostridiales bacterium]|nr:iron-containing alcohol dehydrogenase [Clostridiales bacterium]
MNGNSWRDLGITEAEVEEIVRRVLAARGEGVSRPAAPEGYCIHAVKTSFFGRGSVRMLGPEARKLGAGRALIVTDGFLEKSGAADRVRRVLEENGIACDVFSGVQPNPTVQVVEKCIEMARGSGAELLVAVGGGSAIDTAKAAGIVLTNGGRVQDYEGVNKSGKPCMPVAAVNTTAGTGSECTAFYIVTDPSRGSKMAMIDPNCMVSVAVNDIDFMLSMPPKLTASTGLDALTHAIEAACATGANPYTDHDAYWAITAVTRFLPRAVKDGKDAEAREMMAYAENIAGMAFSNAGLGMVHAMAHALGGHSNLPHGVCNAVLLPYVLRYNSRDAEIRRRLSRVAEAMDLPERTPEAVIARTHAMAVELGIPPTLREAADGKVRPEDFGALADLALHDSCMATNLVMPTRDDVIQTYENAWRGSL